MNESILCFELGDETHVEFALPSPFATWTITIANTQNKDLDLSEAKGAYFEFSGWARSSGA